MPYQERQSGEATSSAGDGTAPVYQAQEQPNNARTIRIVIVLGLIAAVIVAVFGRY